MVLKSGEYLLNGTDPDIPALWINVTQCSLSTFPRMAAPLGAVYGMCGGVTAYCKVQVQVPPECDDGRDETGRCPFSSPECRGFVASCNQCFKLITMKIQTPRLMIAYECLAIGGRLASFKTRQELEDSQHIADMFQSFRVGYGFMSGVFNDPFIQQGAGMVNSAGATSLGYPMFPCEDGTATVQHSMVCDFRQDCRDHSDKSFCEHPSRPGFLCSNGQHALPAQRCNESPDCVDDSDEKNCDHYRDDPCHFCSALSDEALHHALYISLDVSGYFTWRLMPTGQPCTDSHYRCTGDLADCLPSTLAAVDSRTVSVEKMKKTATQWPVMGFTVVELPGCVCTETTFVTAGASARSEMTTSCVASPVLRLVTVKVIPFSVAIISLLNCSRIFDMQMSQVQECHWMILPKIIISFT
ncbi:hypothetical protein ACOMHN_010189 [Nucella lapillus]